MPKTEPKTDTATTAGSGTPAPAQQGQSGRNIGEMVRSVPGPLIGLVVIFVAMSFLSPFFLTVRNLVNIISQVSDIGIMAVGAAMVIIIGGIDLSVGSTLAFSVMTMAWLYKIHTWPFLVAVLVGILVGALVGLVNGLLSTYARIQPFVATLATMSAGAGLALFITNGNPVTPVPRRVRQPDEHLHPRLPARGHHPRRGLPHRRLLAALPPERPRALRDRRQRGGRAPVRHQRPWAQGAGLRHRGGARRGRRPDRGVAPGLGRTDRRTADLLNVIAVVVIGGASLAGGSGTMFGTFVGLLIIGTLNNGMSLLNVSPNLQPVVIGIAIIVAVLLDRGGMKSRAR